MKVTYICLYLGGLALALCGCATSQPQAEQTIIGPSGSERAVEASTPRLARDGFAVLEFRAMRDGYDRVHIVGEVKNVSTAARGVELQASLRDAEGRLLAVGHFYPASNHNIMPNETWPFAYSFGRYDEGIRAELRIVGGFRTIEGLGLAAFMP